MLDFAFSFQFTDTPPANSGVRGGREADGRQNGFFRAMVRCSGKTGRRVSGAALRSPAPRLCNRSCGHDRRIDLLGRDYVGVRQFRLADLLLCNAEVRN